MEHANKAEAERCIELAKDALRAGDMAKAKRLLKKAMSMDASDETRSAFICRPPFDCFYLQNSVSIY